MLKDVGMTVQKLGKEGQYICSKTGDEDMQRFGLRMLLLLHALIPHVTAHIVSLGLHMVTLKRGTYKPF